MVYGIYIPSTSSSALPPGLQAPSPNHTAPSDIVGDTGARVIWERPAALGRRAGAAHFKGVSPGPSNPLLGPDLPLGFDVARRCL